MALVISGGFSMVGQRETKGRGPVCRRVRFEGGSHLVAVPPVVVERLGLARGDYIGFHLVAGSNQVTVKRMTTVGSVFDDR